MRHLTNRERAERKAIKAIKHAEKAKESQSKQIHVSFHDKPGYAAITQLVHQKTSLITIRNAHKAKGITKLTLSPKLLWTNGTYNKREHGPLK